MWLGDDVFQEVHSVRRGAIPLSYTAVGREKLRSCPPMEPPQLSLFALEY